MQGYLVDWMNANGGFTPLLVIGLSFAIVLILQFWTRDTSTIGTLLACSVFLVLSILISVFLLSSYTPSETQGAVGISLGFVFYLTVGIALAIVPLFLLLRFVRVAERELRQIRGLFVLAGLLIFSLPALIMSCEPVQKERRLRQSKSASFDPSECIKSADRFVCVENAAKTQLNPEVCLHHVESSSVFYCLDRIAQKTGLANSCEFLIALAQNPKVKFMRPNGELEESTKTNSLGLNDWQITRNDFALAVGRCFSQVPVKKVRIEFCESMFAKRQHLPIVAARCGCIREFRKVGRPELIAAHRWFAAQDVETKKYFSSQIGTSPELGEETFCKGYEAEGVDSAEGK